MEALEAAANTPRDGNIITHGTRTEQWNIYRIKNIRNICFHTFGKFQPGEDPIFINSLQTQGFSSYFTLESLPTKDKVGFYEIISKYLNPGKIPEPFDVSLDGISGDGSTIATMNYNKCRISEYLPHLQNFVFVYLLSWLYMYP